MTEFEPNRKSFIDDNYRRAQEIVSMLPMANYNNRPFNQRPHRHFRKHFSSEEKAAILARVRMVGVEKAAEEVGTSGKIIMRWLENIDRDIQSQSVNKPKIFRREEPEEIKTQNTNIKAEVSAEPEELKAEDKEEKIEQTLPEVEEIKIEAPIEIKQEEIKTEEVKVEVKAEEAVKEEIKAEVKVEDEEVKAENKEPVIVTDFVKKSKDFTEDEKSKILARSRIVGASKAAREFGTSRWVIMNWSDNVVKRAAKRKKGRPSPEEIKAIVEHAEKVGYRQAARDFGVTRQSIARWKRTYAEKINLNFSKPRRFQPRTKINKVKKTPLILSAGELENIELKNKVSSLTEEIKKLQAELKNLLVP